MSWGSGSTQRFKQRRGELDPAKVQALDAAVPGWRTGRRRGRKSKGETFPVA